MKDRDSQPSLDVLGKEIGRLQQQYTAAPKTKAKGVVFALQAGIELAAGALVGSALGLILDKWLGTSPVFFILGFFLGCAGGFYTLYRTALWMERKQEKTNDESTTQ